MDQVLVARAEVLGAEYEREYRGCGQCVLAALQDGLEIPNKDVFRAASAFAGGVGLTGDGCCGAYLGAIMVLSTLRGRDRSDFKDPAGNRREAARLARRLRERFIAEYGSVTCRDIQTKTFGRPYYIFDPDDMAKFDAAGGHTEKCPMVVGRAAGWAASIILEEGLLDR
ncbi:MAG: C-GCAxxG-C-C family protein [Dehalococcoidales bacterium]|nr:C-GCAxxG-C-C family protein [Dehalococcoidales bacterium]